jgi:TPP-dependent pyruvate/acetoin dehydrogenase alpha subunit
MNQVSPASGLGNLDRTTAVALFERMLLIRRFEEMCIDLHEQNVINVHLHVYIGQEATGVGVTSLLNPDDLTLTTHRNHGHVLARGSDPARCLGEMLGRANGLNRGRGGTFHLSDRSCGFLATSALVGGSVGLASGAAYALRQAGGEQISVAFFGDGSLEEGASYETFNVAALRRLPVVFVCENNSRGAAGASAGQTPSSVHSAPELANIPRALGIHTLTVDGSDLMAVRRTAAEAIALCRRRQGPVFIEAATTRWPGSRHIRPKLDTGLTDLSLAWEPQRIAGEHAAWIRNCDPILRYLPLLARVGFLDLAQARAIDEAITARVEEARMSAMSCPYPDAAEARSGVFA